MHQIRVVIGDRRAAPEIPIEIRRGRRRGLEADRVARFAAIAVGNLQSAEPARLNRLVQSGDLLVAAALRAVLDHDAVALLRGDRRTALGDVVTHRFLDVDVFARLGAPDRHKRVPVVGRGDGDRVEGRVFERTAKIGEAIRGEFVARFFLQAGERPIEDFLVGIDEIGDLDILLLGPAGDVGFAAAVETDDGDAQPIVGPDGAGIGRSAAGEKRGAGGERGSM